MMLRTIHYFTALVALSGMSLVYQNLVTPWMTPPAIERIELGSRTTAQPDRSLHELFPSGTWQRGRCRQLQTRDATLLFQELEQESENRLRLSPITVIVGRGMSSDKDPNPVIIEAAEGAEITFAGGLNLLGGSEGAPPIESGKIQGAVHIHRSAGPDDQPFDIHTSNVGIRNRKVWTTEAIDMKVGEARCVGSDLTIHLAAPASASRQNNNALLDRIELIYLDQLTVPMPTRGEAGNADSASAEKSIVSINCEGRLEYDFAVDQLELHDSVSFTHQAPSVPPDEFRCDLLKVRFRDPTNAKLKRIGPLDWLVEIIATGSPASVKAPSFNVELYADQIEFHAVKGLLQAHGKDGVQIRRGGINARLANLVYQFDAKNPESIGAIDVQGAGIVHVRDPKIPLRKLQWRDRFKMFPTRATTADNLNSEVELQIDGDFHAWQTDGGEIQANSIAAILKPEVNPSDPSTRLVPDRLKAVENVRIETSAVSANTQQLFVEFVSEPDPPVDPANPQSATSLRNWVTQPAGDQPFSTPVARPRPEITGDAINVQLRHNESGLNVKRLSIAGSVVANHQLEAGGQTLPAKFTGELLQLVDAGGGDDVLQITGGANTPARFDFGDGFFIGPRIQIRPSDNYVWINEAGEFRIPTAALPAGLPDQPRQKMQWTKPPHCRWKGEMRFDGRTALLTGGIHITAAMINNRQPWDIEMVGDRLRVDLLDGVQVRDVRTMQNASVQSVSLMQASDRPVLVRAIQRAADGIQESKHMLQASKLVFSPASGGGLVGEGPGWYRGWFVPRSGGQFLDTGQEPADLNNESGLTGVHLVFGESMRADFATRSLNFMQGVRVGTRTVADWEESFDAMAMDAISKGESTLDCDQLGFVIEPGFVSSPHNSQLPVPWEVEALRGVVFRTRNDRGLIEVTAARAAYTSSKQLFTADGAPNRPSVVRQTRPDGSAGLNLRNRTISIKLDTMTIVNQELEGFNFPAQ